MSAERRALAILRHHGMRISKTPWADAGCLWDGETLNTGGSYNKGVALTEPLLAPLLMHELGHFLVSPYKWRNQPEYGLGTPPFATHWCDIKPMRERLDDSWEEDCAYILGLAWLVEIGVDIVPVIHTHPVLMDADHLFNTPVDGWYDLRHDTERFWLIIEYLNARRLLRGSRPVPQAK